MIIDCTRKPLLVLPDEQRDQVVVRSIGNREVTGQVTFRYERRATKQEIITVKPGAELTRGDRTCFETRLDLPGSKKDVHKSPYDFLLDWDDGQRSQRAGAAAPTASILPEPYEVTSTFKDPLTGFEGTWRLRIRVEKAKNKMWLVTVFDGLTGAPLVTVGTKSLDPNPLALEPLPLSRSTRAITTGTAWDRILGDDD